MVKFYGYIVAEEWLLQRGIEMGHPPPKTYSDLTDIIVMAAGDVRLETGVYRYTKLRDVQNHKGKTFWCIAFASSDPREGLPTSAPPESKSNALKEALQKTGPPRWFRGA
ncbi:uncharacterized protein F5891DRAFT_1184341 [Suillus fuscotomentosus]|uniref:Uncharacterized protein n=1 Tax=Suillus fuscotomentosus TaxID=1912939 RepID=A0AAD4EDJ7_9AGAM|nr:uncharacterized protein F5891DRAFT_1184341 [Suillus fuscotomentosus]KAG1862940.1 hypothetical protein C8R48DRAFT_773676 [Suillus tomentosus]KAG1904162.1 hypothetical protein F5891DRAFT_1184341 [Suillus fuscotomentosus]